MLLGVLSVAMVLFNPSLVRLIGFSLIQIPLIVLAYRLNIESGLKGIRLIGCTIGSMALVILIELLFASIIKGLIELGMMIF